MDQELSDSSAATGSGADGIGVGFPTPADPGLAAPTWNKEFILQILQKSWLGIGFILGIVAGIVWRDPRALWLSQCFIPSVQQHWEMRFSMDFSMDFRSASGRSSQNPSPTSG